ncbi:MAG: EMC3/TMCO1 family protein [Candidatus Woesearchaeota archaeon]
MLSFLDDGLSQMIRFSPLITVILFSILITFIMTLIYKYATDQKRMKELKERLSQLQKEAKNAGSDTKKLMKINSEMMSINGEYMRHSLKPMLISWIPIILIFAWMSANLAYEPIIPGQPFNVTLSFKSGVSGEVSLNATPQLQVLDGNITREIQNGKARWLLSGEEGVYNLTFTFGNVSYEKRVIITSGTKYENPITKLSGNITSIEIGNAPRKVIKLGGFSMGWFWSYFIFALIFNSLFRKLMKVY